MEPRGNFLCPLESSRAEKASRGGQEAPRPHQPDTGQSTNSNPLHESSNSSRGLGARPTRSACTNLVKDLDLMHATLRKQGPFEAEPSRGSPSCVKARGYCRVSVLGIPDHVELKCQCAPIRLMVWHGVRLARPQGYGLGLVRPRREGITSPNPRGHGLGLARPRGCGPGLARP
jgi:hypothetical protein